MDTTTDPVASPEAYRQLLLSYLGDDDPAVVQASTAAAMRRLLAEADSDARTRPAPGEWSVVECLGHMWDAELSSSNRYRWIVAHDEPDLPGYDQERWAARLGWGDAGVDLEGEILAPFEALRAANIALWHRLPVASRSRLGVHLERGRESYELTFRLIAGHDRVHLEQAGRALAAVRAG